MELPHVFFRWLLLGGEAVKPGQPRSFQPSVKDMVTLDPSLARPFEALKDAVQSKEALDGLLEIEGLPSETPAEEYITHVVRQTFLEPVEWQVSEIRSAFFRALSPSAPHQRASHDSRGNAVDHLLRLLPRPAVLAEIIRGRSPLCGDCSHSVGDDGAGLSSGAGESEEGVQQKSSRREAAKDFDFREVFLVHEDHDLVACSPLREVGSRFRRRFFLACDVFVTCKLKRITTIQSLGLDRVVVKNHSCYFCYHAGFICRFWKISNPCFVTDEPYYSSILPD